jgi:hypothetical protein
MNSQIFTDTAPETIDTTFIGGRCASPEVISISSTASRLVESRNRSNVARLP